MKQLFITLVLLLIISCSNNKESFTIIGETDRVGDAILLIMAPGGDQIHDTTSIKNGVFKFEKVLMEEELFRLRFHDGSSIDLLADAGEKIEIKFKQQNLTITGSDGSIKIMQLNEALSDLMAFEDSITQNLQNKRQNPNFENMLAKSREDFFNKLQEHRKFLKNFIEENQKSKVCLIPLFQKYSRSLNILTLDEDLDDYQKVLENLQSNFPNSTHIKLLEEQINRYLTDPLANGKPAPNFSLPDINGNLISLSDLKGKLVLIDFWASWCGPCRKENPKLVKLHKKYANSNFEILSVSLDGTARQKDPKKAWLNAIENDNLSNFIHVSELTGWETKVRGLYNFNSIPHTVLIDAEGNIIAKKLRGLDLERKIKQHIR